MPEGTEELSPTIGNSTDDLTVFRRYAAFRIYVTRNEQAFNSIIQLGGDRREVAGNVALTAG